MNNKAICMLNEAIKNVPYYRDIAAKRGLGDYLNQDDFDAFPMLSKTNIQSSPYSLISDKYSGTLIKMLRVEKTSGSTGKLINVYWNNDDYYLSNLVLWRLRKKWYGITPSSKCVAFNSTTYSGSRLYRPQELYYNFNNKRLYISKFCLNDNAIQACIDQILQYKPEWMLVQSSTLVRLTSFLIKNKIKLPFLKYIELNGEVVSEIDRSIFDEYFSIPIANMYGAAEVNAIAYECPFHNMHILEDNVYFEKNTNNGLSLVTSLHNHAMPIVKYELGDDVDTGPIIDCKCGMKSRSIIRIKGRMTDRILTLSGDYFSPYELVYCIEKINSIFNNVINQFKIIQSSYSSIVIKLYIKKEFINWENTIKEELLKLISDNCSNYEFNYIIEFTYGICNDINISKYKLFECKINS